MRVKEKIKGERNTEAEGRNRIPEIYDIILKASKIFHGTMWKNI